MLFNRNSGSCIVRIIDEGFILDHRIRQPFLVWSAVVCRYLWTQVGSEDNVGRAILVWLLSSYLTRSSQSSVSFSSLALP